MRGQFGARRLERRIKGYEGRCHKYNAYGRGDSTQA